MQFSNIVARWKGATHDSRIFQNSCLYAQFECSQHSVIILSDSGFAKTNFLFTPYIQPSSYPHQRYSGAHVWCMKESFPVSQKHIALWTKKRLYYCNSSASQLPQTWTRSSHGWTRQCQVWTGVQRCFCFVALLTI